MADYKFKKIEPNYHKNVLEIEMQKGRKKVFYSLPFHVFHDLNISTQNKFEMIKIEKKLGSQAVIFGLEDRMGGDFGVDFVLYHCEPDYEFSPINQIKQSIKNEMKQSKLSVRVVADLLNTSPSQVMRLLKENHISKQWQQFTKLASLVGFELSIGVKLSKKLK